MLIRSQARHHLGTLQHVRHVVVERGEVAVVVGHRAAQRRRRGGGHQVEHGVVADGRVLSLTLGVNLGVWCCEEGGSGHS